ncbi:MAG TPA: hypothetical protein PLZ73_02105 [bacterium]|nr:hypothetical protein [bacterium]
MLTGKADLDPESTAAASFKDNRGGLDDFGPGSDYEKNLFHASPAMGFNKL